jgi:hypothetical protein
MAKDIDDRTLAQALIERNMVEMQALDALLVAQKTQFQAQHRTIGGTLFLVDMQAHVLRIRDAVSGEEKQTLDLTAPDNPAPPKFALQDWERSASYTTLVNSDDGTQVGAFDTDLAAPYGLVVTPDFAYLYNEGRLNTPLLGVTDRCLYGGVFKGKPQASPYDLYLSRDRSLLCVTDRGAGSLMVLSTKTYRVLGWLSVRSPGSIKMINVAFSEDNERLFVTDNQSSNLTVVRIGSMDIEKPKIGQGVLGNLILAPDGKHLYLLTLKPAVALIYLDLLTFSVAKNIKLKGDLLSIDSNAPADLMALSPDQAHLLVTTYLNDPAPFTPVVSVIETDQVKTTRRYSIKDETRPYQFAYGRENPTAPYTKDLSDLLIEAAMIEPKLLWDLKRELRAAMGMEEEEAPPERSKSKAAEADEAADAEKPASNKTKDTDPPEEDPTIMEVEHQIMEIAITRRDKDSDEVNRTPVKANHVSLPPEAVQEIVDILVGTFTQQTQIDLAEQPDVQDRLKEEAEKIRKELEDFDSAIVQIDKIFEGKGLKTVILRDAIVMMLDLKESLAKEGFKVVPTHCPSCRQALLGAWDCQTCGFEIDNPERARKRRLASAEATANLPYGHIAIPDPQGLRLMQLNPFKYIAWHLDPDQLSCEYPVDMQWLPNQNILVADRDGNNVYELGQRGKIFWSLTSHKSGKHQLNEPVRATYYIPEDGTEERFLIVDQGNHRVLEIGRDHEIHWEYGIQGIPGKEKGHLHTPSDIQRTHDDTYLIADTGNDRVVEIKKHDVLAAWGENLGLKRPMFAQRLPNEHTLILDAGNYRLLEIDAGGQIVNECIYWQTGMDDDFRIIRPLKMIRLPNKDIVILDDHKLIQIMPVQKKLIWHSLMDDLTLQPQMQEGQTVTDEFGNVRKVFIRIEHGDIKPVRLSEKINFKRMQRMIADRLRAESEANPSSLEEEEDPNLLSALAADRLRNLITERRQQARSVQESVVETFQPSEIYLKEDVELPKLRRFCVDRHHNSIVRVNRQGEVIWHYGFEVGQTLSRPTFVIETPKTLLIADTGNNRILEVSRTDKEVIGEHKGPQGSELLGPRSVTRTAMGKLLIADQKNKRLVELDGRGRILWEFKKAMQISSPQYVEELPNGHILFVDSMLNSIREIDRSGNLQWSYGSRRATPGADQLFAPEYATRLPNSHTLIADTRNNRVLEVDLNGRIVWLYGGKERELLLNPTQAERLDNGNTLITYNNHRQLAEISPEGDILWSYHMGNDVFLPPIAKTGEISVKQLVDKLTTHYTPLDKRLIRQAEHEGMQGAEVHITLMDNCLMKSVRASLVLMGLEKSGTVIKTFPPPEDILADRFGQSLIIAFVMNRGVTGDQVEYDISGIAEVEKVTIEPMTLD